ncbi:MAG: hypothetical protein A3J28_12190 [Acidobacteria bacterium RIFCSPLOWO2_12_FULL_60_22]|nr:MAG: hypothetical protein A3J28_12190 [Acidobacteria bacterium RIFCSPLOWO2_12_FULL_60_22]
MSVGKKFRITERYNLEFRSEFFNFLNHPNFGLPGLRVFTRTGALQPSVGKILDTGGSTSRQVQFGLKLMF